MTLLVVSKHANVVASLSQDGDKALISNTALGGIYVFFFLLKGGWHGPSTWNWNVLIWYGADNGAPGKPSD